LNTLSDNALMIRVKDGDLDKMGLLFQRYHRPLFSFLYHMTGRSDSSEDMVQNVFYRMLKYRHSFSGEGEFRTWMYHLARNVLADSVKQNRKENHDDVHHLADRIGGGNSPEAEFERKQENEMLHKAIATLSPEHREILVLSRFQELKYHEISDILNISESAIKVRVHRAMGELRNVFLNKANKSKAHDL
jgi:RNA polymerase sigma factor (sigma-70 family)